jgi:hypothetical protein
MIAAPLFSSNGSLLRLRLCVALAGCALSTAIAASGQDAPSPHPKPRVVITADPELDDNNTLIRAILYSSDVKFEGLVYASSQFHWMGDGTGTTQFIPTREYTRFDLCPCTSWRFKPNERFIDDIVDAYAQAYPNLKVHNPDYPSPEQLKSKIKWGNVAFEGDFSRDTDGSNLIKSLLLDDQPGALYVTAQGGESTIARALKSIYDQFAKTPQWPAVRDKVSSKLIIIPAGDQDDTDASYIRPNWPGVKEYHFTGISFGYDAPLHPAPETSIYFSPEWTRQNVLIRGPLGSLYRVWGDGRQMVQGDRTEYYQLSGYTKKQLQDMGYVVWLPPQPKGTFLSEGDTPTFLNLIDNGSRAYENPQWGGWGGRMVPGVFAFPSFSAIKPPVLPPDTSGTARGLAPAGSDANKVPSPKLPPFDISNFKAPPVPPRAAAIAARFMAAAQNDFAARLQWSVTPSFSGANHPPKVSVKGQSERFARPGETVLLKGEVSDPDQNSVKITWWQYNDAGTYPGDIAIANGSALAASFRVPDDAKAGQTFHVVLEATDSGAPPLTRYQRVFVTVR